MCWDHVIDIYSLSRGLWMSKVNGRLHLLNDCMTHLTTVVIRLMTAAKKIIKLGVYCPVLSLWEGAIQNTYGQSSILSLSGMFPRNKSIHWFLDLCWVCWLFFQNHLQFTIHTSLGNLIFRADLEYCEQYSIEMNTELV